MEEWFFKKIEVWLVGLIGAMILALGFFFGWLVYQGLSGGQKLSFLSGIAVSIVKAPSAVRELVTGTTKLDNHEVKGDVMQPAGFTYLSEVENPQYVLVSRYDGNIGWSVIELYREGEKAPLWRWVFDNAEKLGFTSDAALIQAPEPGESSSLRMIHPVILDNGHLVSHTHSGALYELNACGDIVWLNSMYAFHHSVERDKGGYFWVPASLSSDRGSFGWGKKLIDDHVVKVNSQGQVVYKKSVISILEKAGLINLIYDYDRYQSDPIHLNDIQPVFTDGEFVKRGDIYLSLGHLNMVLLYRPSTDELVWYSQDRIMHQHDIDILGSDQITAFDNRRRTRESGGAIVIGGNNEIVRYDLPGTKAEIMYGAAMEGMQVSTHNQGLSDQILESGLMIEETSGGRLIKIGLDNKPDWVFVNRSEDGRLWTMNWSRYIPIIQGDTAVHSLMSARCDG